ncbi:glycosyltransferase family 4 protein [Bacillus sp. FJAT-49711]|uniref:glycosyltransferase family 4 protein n=1 Tax=Bacillus sp. FJAT-49711 TaxID=2833585 RepID=UPI001BC9149A|nr:glycosyltransferase family 4 protein [Bacillus sp. FJAT-49711]MBS4218989.1 glycosyltransferase family 4 protein [Bacillus sp. FJAT-49711]
MKIVHLCLANFFIDNYGYQENMLTAQNKMDGHDVRVLASTETFINNKQLGYIEPSEYLNENGIKITRIPYRKFLPHKLMVKLRIYPRVYQFLDKEKPDVILFHNPQSWELWTVAKYKKKNPHVKLYVDNHADEGNSAKGFVSKNILHKFYYKYIVQKALPYIDLFLYVTIERKHFLEKYYQVPDEKMEFYPLGGTIIEDKKRLEYRDEIREALSFSDDQIVFIHAGKMDRLKKTKDLIINFMKIKDCRLRLLIAGSFTDDVKVQVEELINQDDRIVSLGWKTPDELTKYFCASDLYVQPGSHTVLMEHATCCSLPVVVADLESYKFLLKYSKHSWIISKVNELEQIFTEISKTPAILTSMSKSANDFARQTLDYKKLASKLYR